MAAAVDVVELRLGDRVVDVDRREQQRAVLRHHVETVHAGRGLLAHALDAGLMLPAGGSVGLDAADQVEDDAPLLGSFFGSNSGLFGLSNSGPLCTSRSRHRRRRRSGPGRGPSSHTSAARWCTTSTLPASRPSTRRPACPWVRGRAVATTATAAAAVLGREDVARHPAHVGAEVDQRLDEHRGLHRHVQRAHDLRALERLLLRVALRGIAIRPGISCSAGGSPAAQLGERGSATLNGRRAGAAASLGLRIELIVIPPWLDDRVVGSVYVTN